MLILITGITGNLGRHLAKAALDAGHTVRGLGRNPENLPEHLSSQLESFVKIKDYDDIPALDEACASVDAIVCSYCPLPILNLDGQLHLLRAAERAGVKRYHASSWNFDWSSWPLGVHETYDSFISFFHHARLTSSIKPLYVFTGGLADYLFSVGQNISRDPEQHFWQRGENLDRKMSIIGTGDEIFDFTVEEDAAAFSIALVTSDLAVKGGFYQFCSEKVSFRKIRDTYAKVHPEANVEWSLNPFTIEQVEGFVRMKREAAIEQGNLKELYREYVPLRYVIAIVREMGGIENTGSELFNDAVKRTSLEKYIEGRTNII